MKIFRKLGVRLILIPRSTLVPGGQTVPFKRSSCSEVLLVHSYSYDHCFRCRTQFQAKATTASEEICLFRSNSGNPTASDHCFLPRTKSRVSFSRFCPRNATVLPRRCLPRNLISTLVAAQHAEKMGLRIFLLKIASRGAVADDHDTARQVEGEQRLGGDARTRAVVHPRGAGVGG